MVITVIKRTGNVGSFVLFKNDGIIRYMIEFCAYTARRGRQPKLG